MSEVRGVGSNEKPAVPAVWGADVGRAYTCPSSIKPEGGKVGEHDVKSGTPGNDGCDVLQDEVAGS
ncbi:hypothetical protein Acsp03_27440 [Actinomadura sp. NBRC 104412]|nr:hypothetical protein Acsp03_27440 [Actinomadura sp. NBRC 104412]